MGRSVAVKLPVAFQKANKINGFEHIFYGTALSFFRKKSGVPVLVHLGAEALNLFKDLPAEGVLFPYLSGVRAGDRATEFKQRCQRLGIKGVTLHSYRYAWAERAKTCGYPVSGCSGS